MKQSRKNSEAYKRKKDLRVVTKILAAHMVYVRKAGIDETAARLMRSARRVRNWLRWYDEGALRASRIFPEAAGPCRPSTFWARLRRFSPLRDSGTVKNSLGETQSGRFFGDGPIGL